MPNTTVVSHALADGSIVYDVRLEFNGQTIDMWACDRAHAETAAQGIADAIDVAVGNYNAMPQR